MVRTIAVVAPGAMGSAVGRRLRDNGARVLTSLAGRSEASRGRAEAADMIDANDDEIASEADIILSIVPPAEATPVARRLRAAFARCGRRPLYVDCNAVSPETVRAIEAQLGGGAQDFVDVGIIGGPPKPGGKGPTFYASGPAAGRTVVLCDLGLELKVIAGPVGTASALKMSYAGITKGTTAIAATMVLAASRAGAGEALLAELAASQPAVLSRLGTALPDMLPKAYRWVAEMNEIADFIGPDHAEHAAFRAAAALYERLAQDGGDGATLAAFAAAASKADKP